MRLKVGQGRPEPSILQGHRPDTTLFSTLQGLQMQSGVTVSALRRLVLKELTDKARGVHLAKGQRWPPGSAECMAAPAPARALRKDDSRSREHGRCMAVTRLKIARWPR